MSTGNRSHATTTATTTKQDSAQGTCPEHRPRRRASQTYFLKYQLARNPLKAEEEDLKLALLASMQESRVHLENKQQQQIAYETHVVKNNKQPNNKAAKGNKQQQQQQHHHHHHHHNHQQKQKHPPAQKIGKHNPAHDRVYLDSKRPDTEDFLSFICFRSYPTQQADGSSSIVEQPTNCQPIDQDQRQLNGFANNHMTPPATNTTTTTTGNHLNHSPSNRRRPTRHSPRLARSSIDSLNQNIAYDNRLNYEEDMKKASIALKDLALGRIIGSIEAKTKNNNSNNNDKNNNNNHHHNKHLVKGLLTREFAGTFADEEIIFENIKNHKL